MSKEDSIFESDPWGTIKRPLPRDLYNTVVETENLIASEIRSRAIECRSMGMSVQVWTVLCDFLRDRKEEIRVRAKEWEAED